MEAFEKVMALGWVKSNRAGNTGVGKTLEDVMGIEENNIDAPDLHGFEIKAHRAGSDSLVTLFTKAPTMPKRANNILRENYGSYDKAFSDIKVLHTSVFATKDCPHIGGYTYRLKADDEARKLYLIVKNTETQDVVNDDIYWSYDVLEKIFEKKLQRLAYIEAEKKTENDYETFNYKKCTLYHDVDFSKFIELVRNGNIMFDVRIGAYKSGSKKGKTHDHGSGFRIKDKKLSELYKLKTEI